MPAQTCADPSPAGTSRSIARVVARRHLIGALLGAALAAAAAALAGHAQAAVVTSTFDAGTEGWQNTVFDAGTLNTWVPTGGHPGGYLQSIDTTGGWGWVVAPATYLLGSSLASSTFSFDLRHDSTQAPIYRVRIGLTGAGLVLESVLGLPTDSWATYSFDFNDPADWRVASTLNDDFPVGGAAPTAAQLNAALAGITGLFLAADYNNLTADTGGRDYAEFDNIVLRSADPPGTVPAPSPAMLVALGLAGLALRRRGGGGSAR